MQLHVISSRKLDTSERRKWRQLNKRVAETLAGHGITYQPMAFDEIKGADVQDHHRWLPLNVHGLTTGRMRADGTAAARTRSHLTLQTRSLRRCQMACSARSANRCEPQRGAPGTAAPMRTARDLSHALETLEHTRAGSHND